MGSFEDEEGKSLRHFIDFLLQQGEGDVDQPPLGGPHRPKLLGKQGRRWLQALSLPLPEAVEQEVVVDNQGAVGKVPQPGNLSP